MMFCQWTHVFVCQLYDVIGMGSVVHATVEPRPSIELQARMVGTGVELDGHRWLGPLK